MKIKLTNSGREYHAELWCSHADGTISAENVTVFRTGYEGFVSLKKVVLKNKFIEASGEF